MSQERARGKVGQVRGKAEAEPGQSVGEGSAEWTGNSDQVADKIQAKATEVKQDTRRFADGRVR